MIPKIKQGNSIPVKFTIMENGEQKDMSSATNLVWGIRHADYGCRRMPPVEAAGGSNPYTITVHTTSESLLGVYFVTLSYEEDGESRSVDAPAFDLVAHSSSCSCMDPNKAICLLADTCIGARGPAGAIEEVTASVDNTTGIPAVEVELAGTPENRTIDFKFYRLKGDQGLSAYEVAVENGFEGTEEEWLEWLRNVPIVHEPGDREDAVMSQKSTTELAAQTLTRANEYTDDQIAAIPAPDVDGKISAHNTSVTAHEDIRTAIIAAMQKFADYYTKSETYTKQEVNEQIAELSTARFEVVEVLPDIGETNIIYLLPKASSEASNAYDEYIYLNGVWEIIGTTEIDLSQYATREWVQEIVAGIQQQIDTKVDKVEGKGLSTNDYTDLDKAAVASIETIQSVLAHSDCSLEERVAHLENLLIGVISGEVYIPKLSVKELGVWGKNNLNVTNPGAPTLPPDKIGQFYFDETSGAVYKSTGNASISDWKIL